MYKRQFQIKDVLHAADQAAMLAFQRKRIVLADRLGPVSYTHLCLHVNHVRVRVAQRLNVNCLGVRTDGSGKVVSYGKVLKKDEVKALIQKARG